MMADKDVLTELIEAARGVLLTTQPSDEYDALYESKPEAIEDLRIAVKQMRAAGYPARRELELAVIEAARDVIASIAPIEHDDMRYFSAGDAEDFERLRSAVRAYNKSAEEKP